MKKLSTGHDSTLGNWHDLACVTFGSTSRPVEYLERQIAEHSKGRDAEVAGDESQFLLALIMLEAIPRRPHGVQVNPLAVCPSCGSKCDGASNPGGELPKPGDLAICAHCKGLNTYTDDMLLQKLPDEEYQAMPSDVKDYLESIKDFADKEFKT